jgi:S1-C subfamily serine protease
LISRVFSDSSSQRAIQTDVPLNPGFSGGPVFDECGLVIGMVTANVGDEAFGDVAFALAETTVRSALPDARAHPLASCGGYYYDIEPGSPETLSFGSLPFDGRVYGAFAVEQGASSDLEVQLSLTGQDGKTTSYTLQTQSGTFQFEAQFASARVALSENIDPPVASRSVAMEWCVYG